MNVYGTSVEDVLQKYDYIIHLESVVVNMSKKYSNDTNKARTFNIEESAKREEKLLNMYCQFKNRYFVSTYENFADKIKNVENIFDEIISKEL